LPKSVWQDAVNGKKTLFCGGKIEYDDVLAQRHETVFCWERSGSEGAERYSITFSDALNHFRFNLTGAKSESGSQEVLSPPV
jgi:hypothetical protein